MTYRPPVQDMHFTLIKALGFKHDELDSETVSAVLDEAAKLATDVLAPLNIKGDESPAKLEGESVKTSPGFKEAYAQYCDGGWNAVPFEEKFGGQGLPWALAFPIQEMWQGANMGFGLCPLLTQSAVEALLAHGSEEQQQYYLPKLISGEWTGTMNLTESQAGSDLGLLRAKAEKQDDGTYKLSGQKIFITYGDHDMADNIIHFVIARTPDAPDDVKGISLFIVPKILEDGSTNSLKAIGLEHKLGIHGSPTCTMEFDGATAYLMGEEHCGLKYMFTMMNNARLSVGLQGVAIAEAAYQHALEYANDRVQGKSFDTGQRVVIAKHADIRRNLLSMRSQIEAGRALTYSAAMALDKAAEGDTSAQSRVELLTPIVKSWCTDMACTVASIGLQIHGGMGFIEETGAAQFYRDARILPIYEGTNGIQAADLAFRKVLFDDGAAAKTYITEIKSSLPKDAGEIFVPLLMELETATDAILSAGNDKNLDLVAAMATPYLQGFGLIAGGALLAQAALSAGSQEDQNFAKARRESADFFLHNILPLAMGHLKAAHSVAAYV